MKKVVANRRHKKPSLPFLPLICFGLAVSLARFYYLLQIDWPIVTSDSLSYFVLDLWGNQRLYTVPIVFNLLGSNEAIVIGNILFGVIAWTTLAYYLLKTLAGSSRLIRIGFLLTLGALATSTPTFISDFYIMSESLNISLSLLLLVSIFNLNNSKSNRQMYFVAIVYTIWLVAKQAHVLTSIFSLAGLVLFIFLKRKSFPNKTWIIVVTYLCVVNLIIYIQLLEPTPTALWNVVAVVFYIISKNQGWINWFYEQGWPQNYVALDSYGNPDISIAISDSPNSVWLQSQGISVFQSFLLHHPTYVFFGAFLLPLIGGSLYSWNETVGAAFVYGSRWNNSNFPSIPVNHLNYWWFDSATEFWKVVFCLLIVAVSILVAKKIHILVIINSFRRTGIYFVTIVIILLKANFEWLVAPGDRQRIWPEHATMIRVCLIFALVDVLRELQVRRKSKAR